jgi:hypothetical protein
MLEMVNKMQFKINNIKKAIKALEYYNWFHDGFIKSINIISRNKFTHETHSKSERINNISMIMNEENDAIITISHYNYKHSNFKPTNQIEIKLKGCKIINPEIMKYIGASILNTELNKIASNYLITFEIEEWIINNLKRMNIKAFTASEIIIKSHF